MQNVHLLIDKCWARPVNQSIKRMFPQVEYVFAVNKDKTDLKNKLNAKLDEEDTKKKIEELKKTYWPRKDCENSAARPIVAFSVLFSSLAALLLYAV